MLRHYSKEFWKLFFIAATIMLGLAYYQSTVVLYLLKQFHFAEKSTYEIYGVFAAAAYLCPFVTGWITKKWLQPSISITLGLFFYTLGTVLSALANPNIYLWALTFIALGYGLIYINIFFLIGKLYQLKDPHREGGFTLAYMALNIGAIIGYNAGGRMISSAYFQTVILILALFFLIITFTSIFLLRHYRLQRENQKNNWYVAFAFLTSLFLIIFMALTFADLVQTTLSITCFAMLFISFYIGFKEYRHDREAGKKIILLGVLALFAVLFWTFYKIQDSFILVFMQEHMLLKLGTITVSPPTILSVNPFVILLIAPFVSLFWLKTRTKYNSPITKIAFGLLFMGMAFATLMLGVWFHFPTHLIWIVLFFALIAIAEVILGPGIISMVGQLSNEKYHFILLGLMQLSMSAAGIFSAQVAVFFQNRLTNYHSLQLGYIHDYRDIAMLLIIVSLLIFAYKRFITK